MEPETDVGRFMTRPDILIKRAGAVELIIDTKWKRVSRLVDDPKRGVSQGDIYQMMAYGQIYACPDLLLLYPHHSGLGCGAGPLTAHRVTDAARSLRTATVALNEVDRNILTSLAATVGQNRS